MRSIVAAISFLSATLAFAAPPEPTKDLIEKGKNSFNINCVPCHGPKGAGDGPAAAALNPKPRNYTTDAFKNGDKPENVFKTLAEGLKDTVMVSFAHLPEQERWGLVYYVLELRNAGKPAAPAVVDAGTPKKGEAPKKDAKPKK